MTPFQFRNMTLNADVEGAGAFGCFDANSPNGTDVGPEGMVAEMTAFIRLTEGMRSFIDIGALFGIFSLVFTRDKKASALAIEPSPWAYPFLESHCAANPDHSIATANVFLGDTPGREVNCTRDWKHVVAGLERADLPERATMQEVRLDDMNITRCDAMKIDVEGYECQVLRGASETIRRLRPLIFLEAHMQSLPSVGESGDSLTEIVHGLGYWMWRYDGTSVPGLANASMTRVVARPL